MTLVIKESPEPLTAASETSAPILAECDAYRSLLRDILRYSRRETVGRSVLIAGHRGSGKTTLVRLAIQEAQKNLKDEPKATRPLLVPLHGPDLLGGESMLAQAKDRDAPAAAPDKKTDQKAKPAKTIAAADGQQVSAEQPAESGDAKKASEAEKSLETNEDTRAALRMLTEGLHRAFITELGQAFSRYIEDTDEARELCAQLQVELDHAPELDVLRFIWHKAGKLQSGVLFAPDSTADAAAAASAVAPATTPAVLQAAPAGVPALARGKNQGLYELVAASVAVEAYQRVAGKVEDTRQNQQQSKMTESLERKSERNNKDLFNALTGLLAGGVAGAGVLHSSAGGATTPLAALTAVVTAVAGTAVLNYSSSRSRETSREMKQSFTWDTSIASLDRMLPMMVRRIVDAGLTPIFVVDELDKIVGIEQKMENLIRHLKHLVTEKTFFCFLADRAYFEHVIASSRSKAYGREYTFFSSRLFVHYRPEDLHQYVLKVVQQEQSSDQNEQFDLQLIPFLVLGRAKMHPIDVRRVLYDLSDESGKVRLRTGDIRSLPGYILPVFMQAAVELVIEHEDLNNRLRVDPNFARLAYDALYVPFRSWEAGETRLCEKQEYLRQELLERMKEEDSTAEDNGNLSEADLDLLHGAFKRLCDFLRKPELFIQEVNRLQGDTSDRPNRFKTENSWNILTEIVRVDASLLDEEKDGHSRWLFDPYGAVRKPEPVAEEAEVLGVPAKPVETGRQPPVAQPAKPATESRIQQIREWDEFIRKISEDRVDLDQLAALRLLGLSPAWPTVDLAIRAYESSRQLSSVATDPAIEVHRNIIEQYAQMLETASGAIRRTLLLASVLTLYAPGTGYARLLTQCLHVVAGDLRFSKCDIAQINKALAAFDEQLKAFAPVFRGPIDQLLKTLDVEFNTWRQNFEKWVAAVEVAPKLTGSFDELLPAHQKRWLQFLMSRFRTGKAVFVPEFNDLALRVAFRAIPFKTDFDDMTYADYANVVSWLTGNPSVPGLREAVLIELGFAKQVADALSKQNALPKSNLSPEQFDLLEICGSSVRVQKSGERVWLLIGGAQEQVNVAPDGYRLVATPKGAGSIIGGWKLSSRHSAFPVFLSDVKKVEPEKEFNLSLVLTESDPAMVVPFNRPVFQITSAGSSPTILGAPPSLDEAVEMAIRRSKTS